MCLFSIYFTSLKGNESECFLLLLPLPNHIHTSQEGCKWLLYSLQMIAAPPNELLGCAEKSSGPPRNTRPASQEVKTSRWEPHGHICRACSRPTASPLIFPITTGTAYSLGLSWLLYQMMALIVALHFQGKSKVNREGAASDTPSTYTFVSIIFSLL